VSVEPGSVLGVDVHPRGERLIGVAEHLGDDCGTVAALVQLGGEAVAQDVRGALGTPAAFAALRSTRRTLRVQVVPLSDGKMGSPSAV
jgi:hypothetical protein